MMDLSIIIVNWNTKELLKDCLDALRENLTVPLFEIFVVDNGSTDGSVQMVKERFPEVRLIENKKNMGFARANNIAIRMASGRFLLLLNSDTVIKKAAIEGLMQVMAADPSIGIAGPQLLNDDGTLQNSIHNFPSLLTELTNKSLLRRLFPSKYPGKERNFTEPVEVDAIIGSCMLVRGKAVQQVGLLDEDYFFFFEETDWCLRMRKAGWKIVFDPLHSIYHFQGRSAAKMNTRARIEYWRSRYTYFNKHFGILTVWTLRFGLIFRLMVDLALLATANLGTGFKNDRLSTKLETKWAVLVWHMSGCPADGGLETAAPETG